MVPRCAKDSGPSDLNDLDEDTTRVANRLNPKVSILPEQASVRALYIVACISAGLLGSPVLGCIGGLFLLLAVVTEAPTLVAASVAVMVAFLVEGGLQFFLTAGGAETGSVASDYLPGFSSFIGMVLLAGFLDPEVDTSLRPGDSLDDAIAELDAMKQRQIETKENIDRKQLREELGIPDEEPNTATRKAELSKWDVEARDRGVPGTDNKPKP